MEDYSALNVPNVNSKECFQDSIIHTNSLAGWPPMSPDFSEAG